MPQCVVCMKTRSNDVMRPTRMKRHLTGNHPRLAEKLRACFATKRDSLRKQKLDGTGAFQQQSTKVVETLYELYLMIAKEKTSQHRRNPCDTMYCACYKAGTSTGKLQQTNQHFII